MSKLALSFLLLVAMIALRPATATAAPLGRGFTYRSQLQQAGVPVEGTVTLRFSLWDAAGSARRLPVARRSASPDDRQHDGHGRDLLGRPEPVGQFSSDAFNGDALASRSRSARTRRALRRPCSGRGSRSPARRTRSDRGSSTARTSATLQGKVGIGDDDARIRCT